MLTVTSMLTSMLMACNPLLEAHHTLPLLEAIPVWSPLSGQIHQCVHSQSPFGGQALLTAPFPLRVPSHYHNFPPRLPVLTAASPQSSRMAAVMLLSLSMLPERCQTATIVHTTPQSHLSPFASKSTDLLPASEQTPLLCGYHLISLNLKAIIVVSAILTSETEPCSTLL